MSKLQVDDIVNKDDTGSVGFSKGAVVTGIVTATGGSFSGNVSVGGVLTYEDVTNIDSVGVITARSDISIADKIIHTGDTNTAIRFPAADTFTVETAGVERTRVTSGGAIYINQQNQLGSTAKLEVTGTLDNTYPEYSYPIMVTDDAAYNSSGGPGGGVGFSFKQNSGGAYAQAGGIRGFKENTTDANYASAMAFYTRANGAGVTERLRIDSSGRMLVGTTSGAHKLVVNQNNSGGIAAIHLPQDESTILGYHSTTYLKFGGNMTVGGASSVIFENAGTEVARITSGRLLVGATSSAGNAILTVQGLAGNTTEQGILAIRRSSNNGNNTKIGVIEFSGGDNNQAAIIQAVGDAGWGTNDYPGRLEFHTTSDGAASATERLRIDSSGRLLVGTTSDLTGGFVFQVNASTNGAIIKNASASNDTLAVWNSTTSGNNQFIQFYTEASPTTRGSITYNRAGGTVAYNTTSDYRAKTLLGNVDNSGSTIDALKVYKGVMNGATIERPMLVAHEAQEVVPYCVTGEKDAVNDQGNPVYQQIDHHVLVPLLISEIQQLRIRISTLESQ